MELWNIWLFYIASCEQQIQQPSNSAVKAYIANRTSARKGDGEMFREQLVDLTETDAEGLKDNSF